jgi:hypothetical protein
VPVIVLDSNPNDALPGDEDPIPLNGNPHPGINQQMDVDHQEHFEDIGDLQEVQQGNLDQGWQIPSPPHPAQNDGWDEWPQQEGELVGDNELNLVNNLANQVVVNAVENGLMQHPEIPQDSSSVSSETTAFFRAQGVHVTLELPLPPNGEASRTANLPQLSGIEFDSDFPIRQLANRIGIHPGFAPSPSVEMFIKELAQRASSLQAMLPLKAPLQAHEWNTFPQSWCVPGNWFFNVNNPNWGNNAEASSSTGIRLPRLQLLGQAHPDEHLAPIEQALHADPQSISEIGYDPSSVVPVVWTSLGCHYLQPRHLLRRRQVHQRLQLLLEKLYSFKIVLTFDYAGLRQRRFGSRRLGHRLGSGSGLLGGRRDFFRHR